MSSLAGHLTHHFPPPSFIRVSKVEFTLGFFPSKIIVGCRPKCLLRIGWLYGKIVELVRKGSRCQWVEGLPSTKYSSGWARFSCGVEFDKGFFTMAFHAFPMWPHTLEPVKSWWSLTVNQSSETPHLRPLFGLYLESLYLNMSWRLDSPGYIALITYLVRRLVLAISGSTRPNPPYFFFIQHSFQLTFVRVSYFLPDQR